LAEQDPIETDIAAGHMLLDAGLTENALEHFRALVAKAPRDARTQFALASALDGADREAEAIPVYAEAIRLRPTGELLARAKTGFGVPTGAWMNAVAGEPAEVPPNTRTKGSVSRQWSQTVLGTSTMAMCRAVSS